MIIPAYRLHNPATASDYLMTAHSINAFNATTSNRLRNLTLCQPNLEISNG